MLDLAKAQKVLNLLATYHLTLGAVESLTGGLFSALLTAIPGASQVFKGSIVSYSSSVKEKTVLLEPRLITKHGVVSQPVANAMALNGRKILDVNICVSFTGNAGPTKEIGVAPVGRVHMAISTKKGIVEIQQDFTGGRGEIREKCVDMMFDELIAIFA